MRKVTFSAGQYYHVYNRGVDKRVIFTQPKEYQRFLAYLHLLNTENHVRPADVLLGKTFDEILKMPRSNPLVAIGAYCLLPNHYHLYLTPLVENGISKFMQRVQTAYTMYFNEKHKRSGALFQGLFKAEHIERDQHAKYLFSYIHLNPAKLQEPHWKKFGVKDFNKLKKYVSSYPYSSCAAYLAKLHRITDPKHFPKYFASANDIRNHIDYWLLSREARPHGN